MLNWFKKQNKTIEVNTNINCQNCVAKVKPILDEDPRIESWEIDTTQANKTLRVKGDLNKTELGSLIGKAGYRIKE